jgi:UDP-N-acetylglucosamine acyltransferase
MPRIHPTAIVDWRAELAENVEIGAYSIVKGHVTIADGTVVHEHTHVHGSTIVGRDCRLGPGAFVGLDPQHLQFVHHEEHPTFLVIGDGVVIREAASVHRATKPGVGAATRLHDRVFVMGTAHVAHDCVIGEAAILAQGALLGGHCQIGPRAFLGGGCVVHQFVRIGRLAIVGGNEPIGKDLPPFSAAWDRRLKGYNAVGCRRAGLSRPAIASIRAAYQQIHQHRSINEAVAAIVRQVPQTPEVREILEFIAGSKRGIQPSRGDADSPDGEP